MQPSQYDIQREVEALRDIRRRSTTPGALTLDPDLPNQSSSTSPTSAYWSGASIPDGDSSSSSHGEGSSTDQTSVSGEKDASLDASDDPFHLFWVPASLHPEIAPAEFRAFLKEHARSPPPTDGSATVQRSNSSLSGLGRKKSMLSRPYRPPEEGGPEEDEEIVPLRRNRTSIYSNQGPQLTISDLQKLEELAEEAHTSDDPSKLRNILRRSLSMNISPTTIDTMDDMPDMGDEADAPIIVPPPGQILRRAARTKIRKPGLPGDGGGHRFTATRRGPGSRSGTAPPSIEQYSDMSSSDHGDSVEYSTPPTQRPRTFSNDSENMPRPDSFSEEASIFDSYVRDEDEDEIPSSVIITTSPPPVPVDLPPTQPPPPPEAQPALLEALAPVIHHPQPQRLLSPTAAPDQRVPSRTPSPSDGPRASASPEHISPARSPPSFLNSPPSSPSGPSSHSGSRKEKDKKGLFGKWGSDKGGKKSAKEKERENRERAEKEKESGFFGSLFGKKAKDSEQVPQPGLHGSTTGREAAQALLGQSKSSKSYVPPPSPNSAMGSPGVNNYSRYPIHVERAIYRLSHIKLANPRRPLYEQVLISNLMFWYLGVINKPQTPGSPPNGQAAAAGAANGTGPAMTEQEKKEREQNEEEQNEQAEKERLEKERQEKAEREQREREMEMKKRDVSPRRGPLTKPPPGGAAAGARRAEMPVKGPRYEMQHREMEQEYGYGGFNGQSQQGIPMGRSASTPMNAGTPGQQTPRMQQQTPNFSNPVKLTKSVPDSTNSDQQFYYSPDMFQNQQPSQMLHHQQQPRLPPGAMPPVDKSVQAWHAQPQPVSSPRKHSASPPPMNGAPHRRSRSPPPMNPNVNSGNKYNHIPLQDGHSLGGGKLPGRSLSATVAPATPHVNGKLRKGTSAYAAVPMNGRQPRTSEGQQNGVGEEEDMPLAVWQQQRRR